MKGRKPQEFLLGERIYTIAKGRNGRGDLYGVCYLPKEIIGKRVRIDVVNKKDFKLIEVVKRTYSSKKIQLKGGKKK